MELHLSSLGSEAATMEGSSEKIPNDANSGAAGDNQTKCGETKDKMSENTDLPSSSPAMEGKEVDPSAEKGLTSSPEQLTDSTGSEAKEDKDYSEVGGIVSEDPVCSAEVSEKSADPEV